MAPSPLSTIAWAECLRLFADADRTLGRAAFEALVTLATTASLSPMGVVSPEQKLCADMSSCLPSDSALSGELIKWHDKGRMARWPKVD